MRLDAETWRALVAWSVAIALLYVSFEVGRGLAGHSALTAFQQRRALADRVATLEEENAMLERRVATEDVTRRIDAEAQAETQSTLGELQAELARQQQELEFYRGLVAEKFGSATLKVQELSIQPDAASGRFTITVTLVQTATRNAMTRGTLTLAVSGAQAGALTRLPLAELNADGKDPVPFTLRFFKTIDVPVTLPQGFEPAAVELEFRSDRTGPEPISQSFPWKPALAGPADAALTPGQGGE